MARKVKEKTLERLATERAAIRQIAKDTYTTRLMAVLEESSELGFVLTVKNSLFIVTDVHKGESFTLSPTWSDSSDETLEVLDYQNRTLREQLDAETRKWTIRAAAIEKLSAEEREVLGL